MTKDEFKCFVAALQTASNMGASLHGSVIALERFVTELSEHDKELASVVNDWFVSGHRVREHIASKLELK